MIDICKAILEYRNEVTPDRMLYNKQKMEYMRDKFGEVYYNQLGECIEFGLTVQEAIDTTWKILVDEK